MSWLGNLARRTRDLTDPTRADDLAALRSQLVNDALLGLVIISVPGLVISLWRYVLLGWKPVFTMHLGLFAMLLFIYLRREHISYILRAAGLLVMFWLVAYGGMLQFGLAASGREFAVMFSMTSILLIGGRAGWWLVLGNVLCMALVGLASVNHWLNFDLDYQTYTHHPAVWGLFIWNSAAYTTFVAYVVWRLVDGMREREREGKKLLERQQKIDSNVPGVIYQFLLRKDGTTCFPYASEGTKILFGLPPQVLQENADLALSLVHPDDVAGVRATFMASARNLTTLRETIRVIHPEKGVIWIERASTPERLPNGDTVWHGFMTDVSDRVRAQDALRTSESLFRSLIDASPLSIAVTHGSEQKLVVLNRRAVDTFGYTLDDLPDAAHWWRLAYPDPIYRDKVKSEWNRSGSVALDTGTVMVLESVVTCRNGSRKPIETHASFADGFGILVMTDLTHKKVAETELLTAKEAAEEANQAKSVFLASMSHELRTPLNSIIGFAQMLDMGAVVPLDPSQKEPIGHILGSGRHLLGLINEVLDLARIEAGRMDLSLARMTLDPMIEEAVALTRPAAQARHIAVHHDCHTTMVVRADVARVRQILLNLLTNAVKYNRDGGRVDVSSVTQGDRVRIIVADTGPGIPEGQRHKLFKPFQRLGAEQTDIEGTGIGLVICKKLAEAMGGDIGFDSEVGVGSRFWMELPLDPTLSDEPAVVGTPPTIPAVGADPVARGRVIYIEDNPVNITVMRHVFRRLPGVELLVAESAEKGLMMVRETRPDLVLMDINLPGMNGMEALRILKANPSTAKIPIIAVSAAALPRDIQAGLEAGFLEYYTKPLDIPVFIDTLKLVLRQHIE